MTRLDVALLRGRIRLIALDLDGTTLDDARRMRPRTAEVLEAVIELGVELTFATGRMLPATARHAARIGARRPLICLNGSLVTRADDTPLHCGRLDDGALRESIELAARHPAAGLFWFGRERMHTTPAAARWLPALIAWNDGQAVASVPDLQLPATEPIYQIHWTGRHTALAPLIAHYRASPLAAVTFDSPRDPQIQHLELRQPDTDKGTGLRQVQDLLEIPAVQTLAIGDWHNDGPLLAAVGHAVAMANATPAIKAQADRVLEHTNDEDGVARFLAAAFLA